jgi:uncharacterized protein (TIGR00266 family)
MDYIINDVGSDSTVTVELEDGESFVTQRGAIAAKSPNVTASTGTGQGGLRGSIKSSLTSGETQLQNTLTADGDGWVELTVPFPCEIQSVDLGGETVYTRAHTYLGGELELDVDYESGSKVEFFKDEGIAFTKVSGTGTMFVAALGGSRTITLDGSETYGVGVQHVVLFDASLNYTLTSVGSISASLLGGEGKICEFNGEGEIVMQTSSRDGLYAYLGVDDEEGSDASRLSSVLDR